MPFKYQRSYHGPVEAVILDWAGTTMDYGCMAPAAVFMDVFERQGVPISMEEARVPMGAHKRVHIQQLTEMDSIRKRWQEKFAREPNDDDVSRMFADFVPSQIACLSTYSTLIPGAIDSIKALRSDGIKIGTTTGYLTEMVAVNLKDAKTQGYEPDVTVCASDVPAGRPYPYMCLLNAIRLGVTTMEACVKVDDTVPGIDEGLNAGMWTVGFAVSGNEVGLSLGDWSSLSASEQTKKRSKAYQRLLQSGAHYVVDSIADLLPCIDDIQTRIAHGEKP
ncbi:MAG TPA: phosphonoacetaldehyde hydrolase [Gammaproteobacteria bacterium]|nr:phosphonoacetaldehyde hydrolase [Gammaproteobacteria bacterium]